MMTLKEESAAHATVKTVGGNEAGVLIDAVRLNLGNVREATQMGESFRMTDVTTEREIEEDKY